MKNKTKNKPPKFTRFGIRRPQNEVDANLVKDHKTYRLLEEAKGSRKTLAASEEVESTVQLNHDPCGKKPGKVSKKKKKKIKKSNWKACRSLCNFSSYVENAVTAAILLLLVMLSQIDDLLVGIVPALPVLVLSTIPQTDNPVMGALLRAIQGPEV